MMDQTRARRKSDVSLESVLDLPPPIDLTKELYKAKRKQKEKLQERIFRSIKRNKSIATRQVTKLGFITPIKQPILPVEFIEFFEKGPSAEMSRSLEKMVRNRIQAGGLEELHPIILAELIQETKDEYSKIIHYACMNLKIKNCFPDYVFTVQPYKNVGKTKKYQEYLLIRKHFQLKWILHRFIVRRILRDCVVDLPYVLCQLDFTVLLNLTELHKLLNGKVKCATTLVHEFYNSLLLLVDAEESKKKSKTVSVNYLDACTGLISVHVSRAIAHTILHAVDFTSSERNEPYLTFNVTFDKGLVLKPTAEEIVLAYDVFVEDIVKIGTKIHVLQPKERRSYRNKYMPLCLTQEFINDCKIQINSNINKLYQPILKYIAHIDEEFHEIYPDINSGEFYDSISDIVLEDGCKKIDHYKEYLRKAAQIPHYQYFKLGQVSLVSYKHELEEGLKRNIQDIFQRLSLQHLWEVTNLCETFQLIHTRATQKPLTTEELVETGKFMAWVKNEHLEELTVRVENSLLNLCRIIDLGVLSEDHLELNSTVVHWLNKTLPIIDEYFVNFEQLKYEAEEILQKIVEDVAASIKDVYPLLVILDNMDDIDKVREYLRAITLHMSKIKEIEEQITCINNEEVCLSFPKSTYSEFEDLKTYVFPFYHLLKLCLDVQRNLSVWQDGQFENLDYDSTKVSVEIIHEELKKMYKTYREKLRRAQDENLPIRFRGTVDDPDILNWPAPLKLCGKAIKLIEDFKPSVEIMRIICNKALRNRHWKAMSEIAGVDITPNAGTTLRKITKVDFQSRINDYEIISSGATKEKQLIDSLRGLKHQWESIKFSASSFKQTKILIRLEEIEAIIDEHTIKLVNMRGSVFVKPYEAEVKDFYAKVLQIDQTVERWEQMQDQYLRLFPIFSTGHLDSIIPKEAELFKKAQNIYNTLIDTICKIEVVIKIIDGYDILEKVTDCLTDLEIVLSGVVTYLETVRLNFPRFYFLADDELLEIVSRKNPLTSQIFLRKLFQGIHLLDIRDSQIMGMQSKSLENLKFVEYINLTDENNIEDICAKIEAQMVASLKYYIGECYKVYKRLDLKDVISKFPQQAVHVMSQVFWTESLETGLQLTHNIKLRLYYQKLQEDVDHKVSLINQKDISKLEELKLRSLITCDLNYRYLVEKILDKRVSNASVFDWEAHPKYYLQQGVCSVHIMNINQNYLYEYLGNPQTIVLTALTDRCYRTLINTYHLHFNGLIQGGNDSGKSETIRALAGVLGVFFLSFRCLPEVDSPTVSRLLKGNSLCGSWICLENFNALKGEVMSVVSQDIYAILQGKDDKDKHIVGGTSITVNPTCFVCLTINRKGEDMPENLRASFRIITMVAPSYERIIEVNLYCMGFLNAAVLSKKICQFYKVILDMLPARSHYFFGLRSLKNALDRCMEIKKAGGDFSEECVISLTLRNTFSQMLVDEDVPIFDNLLKDLFPSATMNYEINMKALKDYASEYLKKNHLDFTEKLHLKITEVFSAIESLSGIILVGEAFTAKSTMLKICEHMFNILDNKNMQRHVVNPSSLDYKVLYGSLDESSNVWSDGVITKIVRDFSADTNDCRKWLILDGPLEQVIESVTTILDGDSSFYLDSGEVIIFNSSTTIIFETETLENSSPSIISRCRIVYVAPSTFTWDSVVKSWIDHCKAPWLLEHRTQVFDLLNWMIPPCLTFISDHCRQLCYPNEINLVKNTIRIVQMILDEAFLSIARKEEDIKNLWTWIQATLVQAGVLGLGSVLDSDSRCKFDEFYRQLWKGQLTPYPEWFEKLEVSLPADGLTFDYHFMFKQRGMWKQYQDLLKNEKVLESPYMHEFLVPTIDTLRYQYLLKMNIKSKHSTLLIGPSSTGKSLLIEDILINRLDKKTHGISQINFSTSTTSRQLQTYILSKLNKRKVGYYTPPSNKNLLLFIDNLNMATINDNGICGGIELLRQYLDNNVWYDLTQSHSVSIDKVNFITAMRPLIGSKKLSQRFLRHFNVYSINEFPEETISRIYTTVLFHIWKTGGFPSDITNVISQIVSATVRIFNSVLTNCKPTLNHHYYVFNLISFGKVIKGCARLKKETYDSNKKIHVKLWAHEIRRVFGDRLIDTDRSWLLENVKEAVKEEFNEEEDMDLDYTITFGTIQDRSLPVDSRKYEQIIDEKNLRDVVSECLKHYNYYHRDKMDLIFFSCALEKLTKICRVVAYSPGNILLLGSSGTGRQSLAKLASYIYDQKLFQTKITENYSIREWNRDLKSVLKEAGGIEKECMLLIGEEQIIEEVFLQNVEFLLLNGDIPDFYDADEKQEILELARLAAQGGNRNLDISSSDVFLYFNRRCKENMHIVLCLNFNGLLRNRLRKHPYLMNCHVIWCSDWPDQSLESIAQNRMENMTLEEELKNKIISSFVHFHRSSQNLAKKTASKSELQVHITSTTFFHQIKLFLKLIAENQFELSRKKKRYAQGLAKLSHAANQILNMQKALANYQPQLEQMKQKAFYMSEQIALESTEVEKASELMRGDETIACEQAGVAQILKSECEAELAQAIPILEDAISALNTLKPSDITLVKSMKNPPDAIKLVMAAVCVIKDIRPDRLPDPGTGRKILDYWGPSKRILGDMNFLQTLKDFDKDNIKDDLMVKIRKDYLPHKDFKPQVVAKASSAAEGLCKWIIAMNMYDMVAKEVAPKKEKLEKAEREYAETVAVLTEKKEKVARLEEKLANLNDQLAEAKQQQVKLQREVDRCNKKLGGAQNLIGSLSEEREKWTEALECLERQHKLLMGDILVSSGIIAYLSPFREFERKESINAWLEYVQKNSIPCTDDFDLVATLGNENKFDAQRVGLPNDNFFLANIVINEFTQYHTIFIDPQYQASLRVQELEKKNHLTIIEFYQDDYIPILKNCVSFGRPILVHKIKEDIPACLTGLLSKQSYSQNEELFVEVNGEDIKLDANFRIYMVSNLDFPKFSPLIYKKVTIINFSLTVNGLGEQLLDVVSEVEKPELKKFKIELSNRTSTDNYELIKLEEKILTTMCESDSDILEDEASIKILDQSKGLAKIMRLKQEQMQVLENTIKELRSRYASVGEYAAFLFFFITDIKKINLAYQFSLAWYKDLYFKSVLNSKRSKDVVERCENIKSCLTYDIFYYVTLSLFEKDRLTFLFLLTTKVMIFYKKITEEQLLFFFKCNAYGSDTSLENMRKLGEHLQCVDFFQDKSSWNQILEKEVVRLNDFPAPWNQKLDIFQKLVLVKALKKDQLYQNIKPFVRSEMGEEFVQTVQYNLQDIYNKSYSLSPVLIFETPGTDSLKAVKNLASIKKFLNMFKWLPLARNQITEAENLLEQARKLGSFVFVQNCHLVPSWLKKLDNEITEMDIDDTHEDFRLWITVGDSSNIPMELLQSSIKIVIENPSGLKQNLIRLYKKEPICDPNFHSSCPGKQKIFERLLYGMAFFHCLLTEKNKLSTINWKCPYLLDEEDFNVGIRQLQLIVNEDDFSVDNLEKLSYVIGKCHYCGKIDNEWDCRVVTVWLDTCLNANVCKLRKYFFNNLETYGLPPKNDYKDFFNYICKLPDDEDPRLYGLDQFSLSSIMTKKCKELMLSSLSIFENNHVNTVIENSSLIEFIELLLSKLPAKLNVSTYQENYVIVNEVKRYNNLLEVILNSLGYLQRSVGGDLEFSYELEQLSKCILTNTFPKQWLKYSYPHKLSLSSYMEDLRQRMHYFKNNLTANRFWLPGFFFPRSLLCKIITDMTKKPCIAIEDSVIEFIVNDANTDTNGVIIDGLFSIGAKWDKDRRSLVELSSVLYESFPPILLTAAKVSNGREKRYECPIYQSEDRLDYDAFVHGSKNFITSVLLPTEVDPVHWIKRGVKLVCQVSREVEIS